MIEYLNLLYGILKGFTEYLTYEKDEKKIDNKRVEQLKRQHQEKGESIDFRWSDEEKIEARKQNGWDYYYEVDKNEKKKFILKNKRG